MDAIVLTRCYEWHYERRGEQVIKKQQLLAVGDRYEEEIARDRCADAPYR